MRYAEGYCLLTYEDVGGPDSEQLWNARDGAAPRIIRARSGASLLRLDPARRLFAPEHVPAVGDRVIVELTERRARVLAAERLEQLEMRLRSDGVVKQFAQAYAARFDTREAALQFEFEALLRSGMPDLLTVTEGYLQRLAEARAALFGSDPDGTAEPELLLPGMAEPAPVRELHVRDARELFDREGRPIDLPTFVQLSSDLAYRIVARTAVGEAGAVVSTVWTGERALFETAVFGGVYADLVQSHATEVEALCAHEQTVDWLRAQS